MFAQMSDEELIRSSDLIVVGEWVGQSSLLVSAAAKPLEVGALAITKVLKGTPGQSLALWQLWRPMHRAPDPTFCIGAATKDCGCCACGPPATPAPAPASILQTTRSALFPKPAVRPASGRCGAA